MKFQAIFNKNGEHINIPVEAETQSQAVSIAKHENPMLASWSVTIMPLTEGEQAKDDRATFTTRKLGRPSEREGIYQRITLEIAEDALAYLDSKPTSRRDYIEKLLRRDMSNNRSKE